MKLTTFEARVNGVLVFCKDTIENMLTWTFRKQRADYVFAMRVSDEFGISNELVHCSNLNDEEAVDLLEDAMDDIEKDDDPGDEGAADPRYFVINLGASAERAEALQRRCDELERERAAMLGERERLHDDAQKMLAHLATCTSEAGGVLAQVEAALSDYAPSATRDYDERGRQLYRAISDAVGRDVGRDCLR